MAHTDLPVPQGVVAGKYRLTRLLGRGGMGAVWEGTHVSLGTRVAVKFIDAEYAESAEARSRFENEARAAARLRSKHVVEIYDHGVTEDARPFIVMEFLHGEPLDKRLERLGTLSPKETAHIVVQICKALTKAHAANIVHRDLKPENVFLVWDEEEGTDVVKVVDFGIAKFSDGNPGSSSATRTGSVLGTPHYMSPEQARGLRSVDYRSDLWSVAVIAYRCIVGRLPFEGEAVGDLLVKLCTAPIPTPSQFSRNVPPAFDGWLRKALSREPSERFASAAELAESLASVCGLSVRGQWVSAEMARADATSPVQSPATFAAGAASSAAASANLPPNPPFRSLPTGAPTTQTPPPHARTKPSAVVAAVIAALVVLGIGGAVAWKSLRARSTTSASAESVPPPSAAASNFASGSAEAAGGAALAVRSAALPEPLRSPPPALAPSEKAPPSLAPAAPAQPSVSVASSAKPTVNPPASKAAPNRPVVPATPAEKPARPAPPVAASHDIGF